MTKTDSGHSKYNGQPCGHLYLTVEMPIPIPSTLMGTGELEGLTVICLNYQLAKTTKAASVRFYGRLWTRLFYCGTVNFYSFCLYENHDIYLNSQRAKMTKTDSVQLYGHSKFNGSCYGHVWLAVELSASFRREFKVVSGERASDTLTLPQSLSCFEQPRKICQSSNVAFVLFGKATDDHRSQ